MRSHEKKLQYVSSVFVSAKLFFSDSHRMENMIMKYCQFLIITSSITEIKKKIYIYTTFKYNDKMLIIKAIEISLTLFSEFINPALDEWIMKHSILYCSAL